MSAYSSKQLASFLGKKLPYVAPNTVMTIDVHPKPGLKLVDLHLDERSYRRVADEHVRGIVYYTNNQEGISITVGLTELKAGVLSVGFQAPVHPHPARRR